MQPIAPTVGCGILNQVNGTLFYVLTKFEFQSAYYNLTRGRMPVDSPSWPKSNNLIGWYHASTFPNSGGILFGIMYIVDSLTSGFWIWLWLALTTLMILINMFYADVIVPIFNKLTPLEDGALRTKIESYSKKVGYTVVLLSV